MAICDWCGIREAFLVGTAREPETRRPRLLLCNKCWKEKWSSDDYDAEPLPPRPERLKTVHRITPSRYPVRRSGWNAGATPDLHGIQDPTVAKAAGPDGEAAPLTDFFLRPCLPTTSTDSSPNNASTSAMKVASGRTLNAASHRMTVVRFPGDWMRM